MSPIKVFSFLFSVIILLSDGIYLMHIKRDVSNAREQREMNSNPSPISESDLPVKNLTCQKSQPVKNLKNIILRFLTG